MTFLIHGFWILLAILLIGKGSDWLTDSLIPLARKLRVSGVSVGLILVSVAVSLPEILVAVYTIIRGHPILTFGVILGSVFCNIGLMTGLSAFVRPLRATNHLILRDGIFSLVVPVLVFAVADGGQITRAEGLSFFLLFVPYVINVFLLERQTTSEERSREEKELEMELGLLGFDFGKLKPGLLTFAAGTAVLLGGSYLFSRELIYLAEQIKISELIIGLTLGAIGPSIPNIAAAYKAAKRGFGEIAVSETYGSNIFTLLVTLGIAAMLSPFDIAPQWLRFDLPALLVMSALLFFFSITKKAISKLEGGILLFGYIAVVILQILLGS